jgi:ubiquinone/menaquinone biosynthesis C-methylase UbiE
MGAEFKDFFSGQADDYAKYRPLYPESLYQYLASQVQEKHLAWDVGAGNGQAAVELAKYFDSVVATDPSQKQLANAIPHQKVKYRCAKAEAGGLEKNSADLITVAQAFHWFDQPKFFAEVENAAKSRGILAVWCYETAHVNPKIDVVVNKLYEDILGKYWDQGRRLVEEGYRNEKFPFTELKPPTFSMNAEWTAEEMLGYLGTWSALQNYLKEKGSDPREQVSQELRKVWGSGKLVVYWPLSLRVFRVN